MIYLNNTISKIIFLVIILCFLFILGCKTTDVSSQKKDHAPLLSQDLDSLINSDGKIIELRAINVTSKWSDNTEFYRIKYLSDGLRVVGFVVKPKTDNLKLPVMIFNRGGNREFTKITEENLKFFSYLSSRGYVVLASQYRGNDGGQGREEFGGKDVNDVLNIIKLAKSLPFVDPSKIVMWGISRGGMMTYLAIKYGAEIKAAAAVGGITDLGQLYHERGDDMKDVIIQLVGTKKEEWEKRSAYYWPERINVPILILHGEADWRVNVSQAQKFSKKLEELNMVHELVVFPQGDHPLSTHFDERNQKILAWFDRFLDH